VFESERYVCVDSERPDLRSGSASTFVQVDAGQAVVTRGPYRWVRHPSYTGLLLIAVGSAPAPVTGCPPLTSGAHRPTLMLIS
jgi:protein-S-isoprenylcysteine O-methyltransferase Ste14